MFLLQLAPRAVVRTPRRVPFRGGALHACLLGVVLLGTGTRAGRAQGTASDTAFPLVESHPGINPLSVLPSTAPMLTVQQHGDRLLAEIPRRSLAVPILVIGSTQERLERESWLKDEFSSEGSLTGRWERAGDSLLLWEDRDDSTGPHQVRRGAYPILRVTPDSALVIDASALFGVVPDEKTFVDDVPNSGLAMKTEGWPITVKKVESRSGGDGTVIHILYHQQPPSHGGWQMRQLHRVWVQWLFARLNRPPTVMKPRLGSPSLGYWMVDRGGGRMYIQRWRVEKKDPTAAVSDVVQPIVYRIDSTVPRKWVPWITKGILAWNPVFESFGLRNAIVVHDGGSPATLPDGSSAPECRVGWQPGFGDSQTAPDHVDRRSGEILHCGLSVGNGSIGLLQSYGFVYLGGFEPRFRYPFPDSVSGRLLQLKVTHEIGHTLGLDERFSTATMYPTDSLRNAAFVHRMGPAASIMSYTFFDEIAQPEDHIPFEDLLAQIGPYDTWVLGAGYGPDTTLALSAAGPASLAQWRSFPVQDIIGSDPVRSADYISRNLARSVPLIDAQSDTSGIITALKAEMKAQTPAKTSLSDYLRDQALNRWNVALYQIVNVLVGGMAPQTDAERAAQTQPVPLDSARQVEALRFVIAHVYYGRDPFVQAVFKRVPTDTTVMLFDTTSTGWTVEQWRAVQSGLSDYIISHVAAVAEQLKTLRILPAVCGEFTQLDQALRTAAANVPRPEARAQATKLEQQVNSLFDLNQQGSCVVRP